MKTKDVVKIVIGVILVLGGVAAGLGVAAGGSGAEDALAALFVVIADCGVGAALILWGTAARRRARREAEEAKQAASEAEQKRLLTPWLCPACGAQTKGDVCEYCGSVRP